MYQFHSPSGKKPDVGSVVLRAVKHYGVISKADLNRVLPHSEPNIHQRLSDLVSKGSLKEKKFGSLSLVYWPTISEKEVKRIHDEVYSRHGTALPPLILRPYIVF